MPINPLRWPIRLQFLLGALICAALLGYALYVQYQMYLEPCPLCIFQRVAFMVMGLGFLAGAVHGPRGRLGRSVYASLAGLGAIAGIVIAGRHLWLQSLPADEVPACGPGLAYLLDAFPLSDVLTKVFAGSGECAKVDWTFAGLSMPAWTLIWFVLLGLWGFAVALRRA